MPHQSETPYFLKMALQAEAMGQAFQAAAINMQLIALPIFSDNVKEDKLTAKQWLEK